MRDVTDRNGDIRAGHGPLVLATPEEARWDTQADIVVVGFGGAGVCAALEARENGADVLAVDRFEGGGATAYSGGIIYAGDTAVQREAGVSDSVDEMARYLALEVGNTVSSDTVRRYCAQSADNLDWLMRHGVPYEGTLFADKTAYPPDGYHLYYSGNEEVAGFKEHARPAPRGHRPVGVGMTGNVMFEALRRSAERSGVRLLTHAPATRLVCDGSGRVIGVEVRRLDPDTALRHQAQYRRVVPMLPFKNATIESARAKAGRLEEGGKPVLIRAKRGVILASGGFVNNLDMMKRHTPLLARTYKSSLRLGSLGCDGSGIELGRSAGGEVARMDHMLIARNLAPPLALLNGILVNAQGRRFINEGSYSGFMGQAIADQPDATAWLIVDAVTWKAAVRQILTSGWTLFKFSGPQLLNMFVGGTKRARTLEGLARKCGIDAEGLKDTVSRYNAACAGVEPDEFAKSAGYCAPIETPSFRAINESIWARMAFTMLFSLGGLKVDEETGEVLRTDGTAISGLYAAGRAALGICSNSYISGLSIGDAVFSGRRAARHGVGSG